MRSVCVRLLLLALVACCLFAFFIPMAAAEEFLLADGRAWPGRILVASERGERVLAVRDTRLPPELIPRVQSLTTLTDGRVIFASGLDRSLMELQPHGERVFQHGGYLARQVRTDRDGTLYWSGLETPINGNPLPDGFIYRLNADGTSQPVLTFSQGDVGRDWWGSFDVVEGRIFVGTLRNRTSIYDVSVSPVQPVVTLPIAVTAFRFGRDGSLYGCDGGGNIFRWADRTQPERYEAVLRSATPFVDFAIRP